MNHTTTGSFALHRAKCGCTQHFDLTNMPEKFMRPTWFTHAMTHSSSCCFHRPSEEHECLDYWIFFEYMPLRALFSSYLVMSFARVYFALTEWSSVIATSFQVLWCPVSVHISEVQFFAPFSKIVTSVSSTKQPDKLAGHLPLQS